MYLLQNPDLSVFHAVNGYCGNWLLDHIGACRRRNQLLNGGLMLAAYWWFWLADAEPRCQANRQRSGSPGTARGSVREAIAFVAWRAVPVHGSRRCTRR